MPSLKEINFINQTLKDLVLISGLSGHETRVRDYLIKQLKQNELNTKTDVLGNLICTLQGDEKLPSIILFAHIHHMLPMIIITKSIQKNTNLHYQHLKIYSISN